MPINTTGHWKQIKPLQPGYHYRKRPGLVLEFSAGSHQIVEGRELEISDESEAAIQQKLRVTDFKHVIEAFDLGEVSFHSGWVFHRAGANATDQMRKVMTVIYMDKGIWCWKTRITKPGQRLEHLVPRSESGRSDRYAIKSCHLSKPVHWKYNAAAYWGSERYSCAFSRQSIVCRIWWRWDLFTTG